MDIEKAKSGGVVVVVGMMKRMLGEPIWRRLVEKTCKVRSRTEIRISGCWTWSAAGEVNAKFMVAYHFRLDKAIVWFEAARDSKKSEGSRLLLVVEMNRAEGCDDVGVIADNNRKWAY